MGQRFRSGVEGGEGPDDRGGLLFADHRRFNGITCLQHSQHVHQKIQFKCHHVLTGRLGRVLLCIRCHRAPPGYQMVDESILQSAVLSPLQNHPLCLVHFGYYRGCTRFSERFTDFYQE